MLLPMFEVGVMDAAPGSYDALAKHKMNVSTPKQMVIAQQLLEESAVLLKNADSTLPILKSTGTGSIAIFGLAQVAVLQQLSHHRVVLNPALRRAVM